MEKEITIASDQIEGGKITIAFDDAVTTERDALVFAVVEMYNRGKRLHSEATRLAQLAREYQSEAIRMSTVLSAIGATKAATTTRDANGRISGFLQYDPSKVVIETQL